YPSRAHDREGSGYGREAHRIRRGNDRLRPKTAQELIRVAFFTPNHIETGGGPTARFELEGHDGVASRYQTVAVRTVCLCTHAPLARPERTICKRLSPELRGWLQSRGDQSNFAF